MPLCCGLHKGVGCRPRAAEHDIRDAAIPATREEPIEAVPLLPVEVSPRLQRGLVGERKRCTVCRPDAVLKAMLFCSKRGERGAPLRIWPPDVLRGGARKHLDHPPRALDDRPNPHPEQVRDGVYGTRVAVVPQVKEGDSVL